MKQGELSDEVKAAMAKHGRVDAMFHLCRVLLTQDVLPNLSASDRAKIEAELAACDDLSVPRQTRHWRKRAFLADRMGLTQFRRTPRPPPVHCEWCGTIVQPRRRDRRFCCTSCRQMVYIFWRRERERAAKAGVPFLPTPEVFERFERARARAGSRRRTRSADLSRGAVSKLTIRDW